MVTTLPGRSAAVTLAAMGISTRVTVGTSATLIATNTHVHSARIRMKNIGAAAVQLGDSTVTTATGFDIGANEIQDYVLDSGESLYGIIGAATAIVEVMVL